MDKVGLQKRLDSIITTALNQVRPVVKPENGTGIKGTDSARLMLKDDLCHLIDEWTAGVIGEDDHDGCALFDEFGYHGKDCDRPGGCMERLSRDELRAEQRRRAGIGGDKNG